MAEAETDLIKQLIERHPPAVEAFVHEHTDHLFNACRGMGFSQNEAEELTQSTWLTFFEVLEKFEERSTLRTFLFGILYNKVRETRREGRRAEPKENIEEILDGQFNQRGHWATLSSPMDPYRFLESALIRDVIEKCMSGLTTDQRAVFVLKDIQEESSDSICQAMGLSASNLGVLLFRARSHLRLCIERKMR